MARRKVKMEVEDKLRRDSDVGEDKEDISLTSWFNLYQNFVDSTADILKDEISNIKKRKIDTNRNILKDEKKPEAMKLSKNIVIAFNDVISKAVKDLQAHGAQMSEELQKRYNLGDDWMQSGSTNTSLAGSEINGPTGRRKQEMNNRLDLMLNDTRMDSDSSDLSDRTTVVRRRKDSPLCHNGQLESGGEQTKKIETADPPADAGSTKEKSSTSTSLNKNTDKTDQPPDSTKEKSPIMIKNHQHNTAATCVKVEHLSHSVKDIQVDGVQMPKEKRSSCEDEWVQSDALTVPEIDTPMFEESLNDSRMDSDSDASTKSDRTTVIPRSTTGIRSENTPLKSGPEQTKKAKPFPLPGPKSSKEKSQSPNKNNTSLSTPKNNGEVVAAYDSSESSKKPEKSTPPTSGTVENSNLKQEQKQAKAKLAASERENMNAVLGSSDSDSDFKNSSSRRKKPNTSGSHSRHVRGRAKKKVTEENQSSLDSEVRISPPTVMTMTDSDFSDGPIISTKKEDSEEKQNGASSDSPTKKSVSEEQQSQQQKKVSEEIQTSSGSEISLPIVMSATSDSDFSDGPIISTKKKGSEEKLNSTGSDLGDITTMVSEEKHADSSLGDDPLANKIIEDEKLQAAYVRVEKLSPTIEKTLQDVGYVTLKGFSKFKRQNLNQLVRNDKSSSDTDDSLASNDSLKALEMELNKLTRNSIIKTIKHKKKNPSSGNNNERKGRRLKRASKPKDDDELESNSSNSDTNEESPLKIQKKILESDIVSCSGSEDIEPDSEESSKKTKKSTRSTSGTAKDSNGKRKTYIQATVSSSGSEKEHMKAVLGSSDSDSDNKKRSTRRKKPNSSGSDVDKNSRTKKKILKKERESSDSDSSDFISIGTKKKPVTFKRKKKGNDSDDSVITINSNDSDSDSDSDFKKSSKRSSKRQRDSSPESKKKKKRRRRIRANSSDDSGKKASNDSDIEEVPQDDDQEGSSQKGRKNIRKIMSNKELAKTTKEAEKEEEERRKRLLEKQNLFNGIHQTAESDKLERLILDVDPETKKAIVEVDPGIVTHLKPHQAEGIKFMYNACFESVEMIKQNKVPGGCILAHCMGLGKTLQSIAFVHTLLTNPECGIKTALIICPLSTVNNWYGEFRNWTEGIEPDLRMHKLFEAKNTAASRADYLKTWKRRGGVGLLHYDMFRRLADPKGKAKMKPSLRDVVQETLLDPGPDLVICDEGHLLKNCKSMLSLAVNNIKTHRRIVLTGTPLQNNLVEYHTMMSFVKPNLLGSLPEFTNRFVNPIKNGQHADSTDYDVKIMKRRAHVLHRKLEGCVQRRDYSILAPYLPPKYEYIINIKLSEKQESLYKHYLNHVVDPDLLVRRRSLLKYYAQLVKIWSHPIALTMRKANNASEEEESEDDSIKDFICDDESTTEGDSGAEAKGSKSKRKTRAQAVNDPNPDNPGTLDDALQAGGWWNSILRKNEMYDTSISGKLVILQEILKTSETIGDKVLVFSQFLTSLDIIEEFLQDWDQEAEREQKEKDEPISFPLASGPQQGRWRRNIEYFRIDGQTKVQDRHRDCEKFNKKSSLSKAKLFLISTKAGGLGINLYGANRVVIFDASWNPSQDMQSIFRVYRFGQDKPCYIYRLIARGTMEEKILRRQITKLSLSSRVVDEHQIERHFKFDDVNDMYKYDEEDPSTQDVVLAVPKDRLLADLLMSHREWIRGYEEFDSLLENKPDEGLSTEEKELAWEEYRIESERQRQSITTSTSAANEAETFVKVKGRLIINHPYATEDQIQIATRMSLQVIEKIRSLILIQHNYPPDKKSILDQYLNPLKIWLQQAVSPQNPRPAVPPDEPILEPLPHAFFQNVPHLNHLQPYAAPRPSIRRVPGLVQHVNPQIVRNMVNNFRAIASDHLQAAANRNPSNQMYPGSSPQGTFMNSRFGGDQLS